MANVILHQFHGVARGPNTAVTTTYSALKFAVFKSKTKGFVVRQCKSAHGYVLDNPIVLLSAVQFTRLR
jgi:hypothetical protein